MTGTRVVNKHNKCNFSKLLSIQTLHESNQIATTSAAQRSVRRSVEITTISNSSFVLIGLDCGQTQARRCGELRNVFSVTFNVVGQRDPINRMVTDISPTIPGQFVPSLLFHHPLLYFTLLSLPSAPLPCSLSPPPLPSLLSYYLTLVSSPLFSSVPPE